MKKIIVILFALILAGCGSNKGVVGLTQYTPEQKHIVVLEDIPTRDSVLPVITNWLDDNGYSSNVVQSIADVKSDEIILSYRAKWSWDMATYMRIVDMKLRSNGQELASLSFDAVNYGGMGKFGNAEKRLKILLDVLFGKITQVEADALLNEA